MVKIEIKKIESTEHVLFINDNGPYVFLEYAHSHLDGWNKMGYSKAILNLYKKYDVKKLRVVPIENYA